MSDFIELTDLTNGKLSLKKSSIAAIRGFGKVTYIWMGGSDEPLKVNESDAEIKRRLINNEENQNRELPEFEKWLRSVCFKRPTLEAYYLAKAAWEQALSNIGSNE